MNTIHNRVSEVNLQATVSAASANAEIVAPHHPIMCAGQLYFHEDGRFECEHAAVPPGDERTVHCVQHSIAILLVELAVKRFG